MIWRICLVVTAVLGFARVASAHQISATTAKLEPTSDPARIRYEILIAARDLTPESDREVTRAEIASARDRIAADLAAHVRFTADGVRCATPLIDLATVHRQQLFARATIDVRCAGPVRELVVDYDLFFDRDPRHIAFVTIDGATTLLRSGDARLIWRPGATARAGIAGLVVSGIEHILFGFDHILFLVSLLLMAVVMRTGTQTTVRPIRDGLGYTGAIVTSFTVAHSVTLIAAALGWIELPGRLVESTIAASILFVAIQNVVWFDPHRRYLLAFGFGLVHGLGFASMLRPLLPPDHVVAPLLAFNLGVELGQLGIVLVALPLFYALAHALGATGYRRRALPAATLVIGGLALVWLLERSLEITILGL